MKTKTEPKSRIYNSVLDTLHMSESLSRLLDSLGLNSPSKTNVM